MQINHIVLNKDLGFQIGFPKSWAVAKSRKKMGLFGGGRHTPIVESI